MRTESKRYDLREEFSPKRLIEHYLLEKARLQKKLRKIEEVLEQLVTEEEHAIHR